MRPIVSRFAIASIAAGISSNVDDLADDGLDRAGEHEVDDLAHDLARRARRREVPTHRGLHHLGHLGLRW